MSINYKRQQTKLHFTEKQYSLFSALHVPARTGNRKAFM